jgi:hypothetical protein
MSVTQTNTAPVVLLIDEERATRLLLRIIMEGSGYRVFDAATGKEGILQAAQRRTSVILLAASGLVRTLQVIVPLNRMPYSGTNLRLGENALQPSSSSNENQSIENKERETI